MVAFDTKERQPRDTSDLKPTALLFHEGFEPADLPHRSTEQVFKGQGALLPPDGDYTLSEQIDLANAQPGDWLRISLRAYMPAAGRIWNQDLGIILFAELRNAEGRRKKRRLMRPTAYIGNSEYSIWHAGTPDQWGEAAFFFQLPHSFEPGWHLRLYLHNPSGQRVYLDEVRVGRYVPKN
jgi:hypothetical protein